MKSIIIKPPRMNEEIFAVFMCYYCGCKYIKAKLGQWGKDSLYNSDQKRVYNAVCPACGQYNQYVDEEDISGG